jgi:hypothetical protein
MAEGGCGVGMARRGRPYWFGKHELAISHTKSFVAGVPLA